MTSGKRTTAFALAGAVALASGAYALGSETGDGSAEAAKASGGAGEVRFAHGFGPGRPGHGPRFDGLADRLGVEESALRGALDDIAADHRTELAQRLADALNIDRAKVEQTLENLRPDHPHIRRPAALAAALAKELGLSTAKVRAALEQHHGPDELADALGVSEERLHEAFRAAIGKPRVPHRPGRDDLAQKLGVTQAQLDAAFEKLRDQFAQELADRLNLDVAKVKEALAATPRFGGRRGP